MSNAMTEDDDRFLRQLMATFRTEAEENLATMSLLLGELRRAPSAPDAGRAVERLFRETHSLKGAARAVNVGDMERVCQAMERVLSALKHGARAPTPPVAEGLQRAVDGLARLLARHASGGGAEEPEFHAALVRELDALLAGSEAHALGPTAASVAAQEASTAERAQPLASRPVVPVSNTVRAAVDRLDSLMAQAEELQASKFVAAYLHAQLRGLQQEMGAWSRQVEATASGARAFRRRGTDVHEGSGRQRRALLQLADAADRDERRLRDMLERLSRAEADAARHYRGLCQRLERLRADTRQLLMLPFATLFAPLPKLVRELAQDRGKEVQLDLVGGTLEVDRRILEQLQAPLNHLVRNSVDHGIELPGERIARHKPTCGRLRIAVAPREGSLVELTVSDDGVGIDLDRVRERAVRLGLLHATTAAEASPQRLADLVFASGLSTRAMPSDLSGHGLGLAIVREKVEALGGRVAVEPPRAGQGATFRIELPAMLTTIRGLRVRVAGRPFVLPTRHVERVARVRGDTVRHSEQGGTVVLHGVQRPLASLAAVLRLAGSARDESRAGDWLQLVVATSGHAAVAFRVDEVEGDEEMLVKPIAPPLRRVRYVAGATVLGAGEVVPLLHVADLVASVAREPPPPSDSAARAPRASVLLADDSVTVRLRLQHMLEAAGYQVSTATDGLDALSRLQSGRFDVLVSDVEMPRLDGYGLTARVRSDPQLARVPVVLVTGLDSAEDERRGMEAGANAYITKTDFEQGRLLEAIQALV